MSLSGFRSALQSFIPSTSGESSAESEVAVCFWLEAFFFSCYAFSQMLSFWGSKTGNCKRPIRADSTAISQNVATAETATHSHFNNQWESAKHLSRKPLLRSLLAKARSMSCRLSSSWCVFKSAARAKLNCTQMFSLLSSPAVCIYSWENQTKQQITTKKKNFSNYRWIQLLHQSKHACFKCTLCLNLHHCFNTSRRCKLENKICNGLFHTAKKTTLTIHVYFIFQGQLSA